MQKGEALEEFPEGLLSRLVRSIGQCDQHVKGLIDTVQVLVGLAETWPAPLGREQLHDVEALVRKVHVAKDIMATYGDNWKKLKSSEILDGRFWPLLIAVLLSRADVMTAHSNDDRGLTLKCLNAALSAIDKASVMGFVLDPELPEIAESMLDRAQDSSS